MAATQNPSGDARRRVLCHTDAFGLFTDEHSRCLDNEELPADVMQGTASVQLQLPASQDAWAHHVAEIERHERHVNPGVAEKGKQSVTVTNTKEIDKKTFYQVTWVDKRGRTYVVWKRYSRFATLR